MWTHTGNLTFLLHQNININSRSGLADRTGMQQDSPWCQQSPDHSWSCVMTLSHPWFVSLFFSIFAHFSQSILSLHPSLGLSVHLHPSWWVVMSRAGCICVFLVTPLPWGEEWLDLAKVYSISAVQVISQIWLPQGLTNANVFKIDAFVCDVLQWSIYCLSRLHRNTSGRYTKVFHVFNPWVVHMRAFVMYFTILTF